MKYIAKSLVVASALIGASTASAMGCFDFGCTSPYFGAEYEWTRSNTHHRHNDFFENRNHSLAKSYNGGNIFLGARWCDFALEAGYDFTGRKTHSARGLNNTTTVTTAAGTFTGTPFVRVKNRFDGWHLDLNGYMPVCDCLELIGSLGYGWTRAKFNVNYALVDTAGTVLVRANDVSHHSNYKGVFRLGVGAQYMVTECVGLRTMVRWKNINHNNRARSNSFAFNGTTRARDAVSVSAGAFVKF